MQKITLELANQLLDRAVAEKGADHVYPIEEIGKCVYTSGGEPACLVGHVLHYAGFTIEELSVLDGMDVSAYSLVDRYNVAPEAAELLGAAQDRQDYGAPWGQAVASARNWGGAA